MGMAMQQTGQAAGEVEERRDFNALDRDLSDLRELARDVLELASSKIGGLMGPCNGPINKEGDLPIGPSVLDSALDHASAIRRSLGEIRGHLERL